MRDNEENHPADQPWTLPALIAALTSLPVQALSVPRLFLLPQEAKVLQEIQLFQVAARKYNFPCEEKVEVWFHSREWLNENER